MQICQTSNGNPLRFRIPPALRWAGPAPALILNYRGTGFRYAVHPIHGLLPFVTPRPPSSETARQCRLGGRILTLEG